MLVAVDVLAITTLQFDIFGTLFVLVPWIVAVGWLSSCWASGLDAGGAPSPPRFGWFIGVIMSALVVGDAGGGLLVEIPIVIFFGVFATMPIAIAVDLAIVAPLTRVCLARTGAPWPRTERRANSPFRAARVSAAP